MGRISSADFVFKTHPPDRVVLDALLENGWTYSLNGEIWSYVTRDASRNDYSWKVVPEEHWPVLYASFVELNNAGSAAALRLRWGGRDGPGGSFHFYRNGTLMVIFDAYRPRLPGCEPFSDASWYLQRILPALLRAGLAVEEVATDDYS